MQTWHVVHATGIIQAVYGGALRDMADNKAKDIEKQTGSIVSVTTVTGPKPTIGDKFIPAATPVSKPSTATFNRPNVIRE